MADLSKTGGIIMLISLFLPVLAITAGPILMMLWIFGYTFIIQPSGTRAFFWPDIIGIIFMILILVFSIQCIKKEPGRTKVYGILSLVFIILYFLLWYAVFSYIMDRYDVSGITVLPFIGFFGIAIGSILNIIAK